jgi:hypothetical protein
LTSCNRPPWEASDNLPGNELRIGIELRPIIQGESGGLTPLMLGVLDALFRHWPEHEMFLFCTPRNRRPFPSFPGHVQAFELPVEGYYPLLDAHASLIDFHDRFPEKCLLVEGHAAAVTPHCLTEAIAARFGDHFDLLEDLCDNKLFQDDTTSHRRWVLGHFIPESLVMYFFDALGLLQVRGDDRQRNFSLFAGGRRS